jgi:hypothetical protein
VSLQLARKVISIGPAHDYIMCSWDDCERYGVMLYGVRIPYGVPPHDYTVIHVFCSERHKQYFLHGHVHYGKLPPGYRLSVL